MSSRTSFGYRKAHYKGIANPIGQIWCGAMMLEHLGEGEAGKAIVSAIERVMEKSDPSVITPDLQGHGSTETLGRAIAETLVADDAQIQPANEEERA